MKTCLDLIIGFLLLCRLFLPNPVLVIHSFPFTDESGMPKSDKSCTFTYRLNYIEPAGCLFWFPTAQDLVNVSAIPSASKGNLNGSYHDSTIQTSTSLKIISHICGHELIGRTSPDHMLTLAATILSSEAGFSTPKEQYDQGRYKKDLLDPENHWAQRALHTTLVSQACMARQMTKAISIPRAHVDLKRTEMI